MINQIGLSDAEVERAEIERIRNKPIAQLTEAEISRLTPQEQRWIWDYRATEKRLAEDRERRQ